MKFWKYDLDELCILYKTFMGKGVETKICV
jgi:hypothetical protein